MLVTRFEIHVSWRIVWREPGGLLKNGVEGGARRQRPQAKHTHTAARSERRASGKHQQQALSVGDCCRVRLAPRSSDWGGARSPQVTPALATHRRSCSPESSTPDLSSSVDAPPTWPASHPPVLQPHQQPPTLAGPQARFRRRCLVKIASAWGDNVQGAEEAQDAQDARRFSWPANVNGTGEILAAWCFILMTAQDKK